jgi:tetraacyldisaccharide 4'-kinase
VHAVAAIGNPQRFFDLLARAGLVVHPHAWPDHRALSAADLRFDDALPVLMTEKDAVKCAAPAPSHHWTLPVEARFDAGDERRLLGRVLMEARLLDLLVCPVCKGPLTYDKVAAELLCRAERLAFPIRDGIPVMLEDEARVLSADDPRLER